MKTKEQRSDPGAARASALAGELRVVIGRLHRRLREQTYQGDLSWSHLSVLARLDRDGPATVTALARAEGVRPQSMGATVSALQAEELVEGAPDPADGRQTILSLTGAGRKLVRERRAAREGWLFRAILSQLSAGEQRELSSCVDLLERLANA